MPSLSDARALDGGTLGAVGGLAIDGDVTVAGAGRVATGFAGGSPAWTRTLDADAGPIAVHQGGIAAIAVGGTGPFPALPFGLRGDPGAALLGFDAATGAPRWTLGVGATDWVIVRAVAPDGDGFLIGGVFSGTLRVGDRVVTSAGGSDGFWAAVGADGAVRSLARMGGPSADAIAGVVALPGGGLAIAGTYTDRATVIDAELAAIYPGPPAADGFVAALGADGALAWVRTWGGALGDTCAGVAVTADGLAIAGTVRDVVDVAGRRLDAAGPADGLIAYFDRGGAVRAAYLVGGADLDGLTAIVAHGDDVIAAGFFAGTVAGVAASGGDDPMIAIARPGGVEAIVPVRASGAAAVHALAADARGWVLAIGSATAAAIGDDPIAAGTTLRAMSW